MLRRLGAGGMASVLLCHDERLDREVAVKRLHADSPGEIEQRFVREAKLGASLNHPNLVSVYDTVVEDEGVLIVMEYVRGESLAVALLRGPLAPGEVATLCAISTGVRPGRALSPASASKHTVASAYTSAAGPISAPASCSGAM